MHRHREQSCPRWPCLHWATWWVLLVIGALSTWQLLQLRHQRRVAAAAREWGAAAAAAGPSAQLQAVLERRLTVPAESPFPALRAAAAESGVQAAVTAFVGPEVPAPPLIFPAEGPLDSLLRLPPAGAAGEGLAEEEVAAGPEGGGGGGAGECTDSHPNADSPGMLHVVFASDISQMEGVQASVASIVASTAAPEELTVHILVQRKWAKEFKESFGLRPECQGTVTVTGVLIRVHEIDGQLILRSVAKVPKHLLKQRGAIDSVENFARFYMHLVLEHTVVVYLDADTIVQADLAELRKQLLASGKTIGFVARKDIRMEKFLRKSKHCDVRIPNYNKLFSMTAYNVGVFAVNLQRWSEQRVAERVEDLVSQHNACGGKLWDGGSQPPLLLAFLSRPAGAPEDFIVFDEAWNTGDLGWRRNLEEKKLRTKYVLHWNGNQKPWKENGLYRNLWLPHRAKFNSLLRPYDAGESPAAAEAQKQPASSPGAAGSQSTKRRVRTTTTLSPEELAAQAACPSVELLDDWTEEKPQRCKIGATYGCPFFGRGMWANGGCTGVFSVSGQVTACGGKYSETCDPGFLPKPSSSCGLMILTSFFTTKKDWQRGKLAKVSFAKIQKLYQTVLEHGLQVSVIYDSLPEDFVKKYTCNNFHFVQVDLNDFNKRYGVNDVRYFFFERLVRQHTDWQNVFIIDAFDVRVAMNPCHGLRKGILYVGQEMDKLRKHPWMRARFQKMGGKYLQWYNAEAQGSAKRKILNCGITGGRRDVMLKLLAKMTAVLRDPAIAIMQKKEDINLNMAALNYIVYNAFAGQFAGGPPVHSMYKRYQSRRKDVWFIHK